MASTDMAWYYRHVSLTHLFGSNVLRCAMSIDEIIVAFVVAKSDCSARTVKWYEEQIRRFVDWLGANGYTGTDWISPVVVDRYLESGRRLSRATVAGHYRALRVFFGWLVERNYLPASPMTGVAPRKPGKRAPRRAEAHEYERLAESIPCCGSWVDARDRLAIDLMFLGGLRLSEVANIRRSDFDMRANLLFVRGKGDKDRYVPILPAVARSFMAYMTICPKWTTDHLMLSCSKFDEPQGLLQPGSLRLMLRRRCRAAGMRYLNPHSFRHGLAIYLLNHGGDMSLIQKILGHSNISTTATHYADWVTDGLSREFGVKMGGLGK
jgi:integrase/recombinase XerC